MSGTGQECGGSCRDPLGERTGHHPLQLISETNETILCVRENTAEAWPRDIHGSRRRDDVMQTPTNWKGERKMNTLTLAKLAGAAIVLGITMPASIADPVCTSGFQTEQKQASILKCKKRVPMAQKGVALTQAETAQCQINSYWNYGPAVTAKHGPANQFVTVR
jgi:hypothetical protein